MEYQPDIENQIICKECNNNKYNLCILICLIILYLIYFTISIITLSNFSINLEKSMCKSSHIWEYLLTSLIIIGLKIRLLLEINNKYINIIIIVPLLLLCWGIYEIYGVSCISNLQNTDLYKIVIIQILMYMVWYGILLFISIYNKIVRYCSPHQ